MENLSREELVQLYAQYTKEQLAQRFDIPKSRVSKILADRNISKPTWYQDVDLREIRRLFIEENLSARVLSKKFGVPPKTFLNFCRTHGIVKSSTLVAQGMKKTCEQKYGVANPFQLESVKEKSRQTCQERYGVNYAGAFPETIENSYLL